MTAHENLSRESEVRGSSDRAFGLVFTAVFLTGGLWPLVRGETPRKPAVTGFNVNHRARPRKR